MESIADVGALVRILHSYGSKRGMLTFHSMGDTDAIASAIILSKFFKTATVATPDFITSHSKSLLHRLGIDPNSMTNVFDDRADVVVLCDVNNIEDCGPFAEKLDHFEGELLVVDHHAPKTISRQASVYDDEGYNSTSSIVFDAVEKSDMRLTGSEADLLALGIISDSAEFMNSTPLTFAQIGKLLQISGSSYVSLQQILKSTPSTEERRRSIEELSSAEKRVVEGVLFVYGRASYQANHMADDAIRVGADVSLFYTISDTEISFSARMRPSLASNGIHLGEVMKSLAHILDGSGGGHPAAAGAYGSAKDRAKEFTDSFITDVVKRLKP
jgi:nanoRNase/pAp phosphatase (c-di-AMP/oligoRNAs hydrolase)